jgi:hypothetical protein
MRADLELVNAIRGDDDGWVRARLAAEPGLLAARGEGGESLVALAAYAKARRVLDVLRPLAASASSCDLVLLGDADGLARRLAMHPGAAHERSGDGWTPLHLAGYFGHAALAQQLLDAGAELGAVSGNALANTPLHAALAGARDPATVRLLVARGADVSALGHGGARPLHLAAARGDTELVELLCAHGAAPDARTDDGRTAADFARERGHAALAERLDASATDA